MHCNRNIKNISDGLANRKVKVWNSADVPMTNSLKCGIFLTGMPLTDNWVQFLQDLTFRESQTRPCATTTPKTATSGTARCKGGARGRYHFLSCTSAMRRSCGGGGIPRVLSMWATRRTRSLSKRHWWWWITITFNFSFGFSLTLN